MQEIIKGYLRIGAAVFRAKFAYLRLIIDCILIPLRKVGSLVLLTQITVSGIRHQPGLALFKKLMVFRTRQNGLSFLTKELTAISQLISYRRFIIDKIFCIQLFLFCLVEGNPVCILQFAHQRQADIHRMERINRNGTVRIGIPPSMAHRRVIHRQHLDNALAGFLCPVNQHTEVSQITDTESLFRT